MKRFLLFCLIAGGAYYWYFHVRPQTPPQDAQEQAFEVPDAETQAPGSATAILERMMQNEAKVWLGPLDDRVIPAEHSSALAQVRTSLQADLRSATDAAQRAEITAALRATELILQIVRERNEHVERLTRSKTTETVSSYSGDQAEKRNAEVAQRQEFFSRGIAANWDQRRSLMLRQLNQLAAPLPATPK